MDAVIEKYRERQAELTAQNKEILARAEAEGREPFEEEDTNVRKNAAEFERLQGLISSRETVLKQDETLNASVGRQTEAEPLGEEDDEPAQPSHRFQASGNRQTAPTPPKRSPAFHNTVGEPVSRKSGTYGFRSFGEVCQSVIRAAGKGATADPRLVMAATTYGNEGVGAEGGFAVPPDYRAQIMSKVFGEDSLLSRTDRQTSSSNTLTFPTDETTPWQSTGGIQAYWEGEGAAATASRSSLQNTNVRLHKLMAFVPVTEELLEDAPAMGAYVSRKAAEKIDFKTSLAIVQGTGVGQPLGFRNSGALVTQAAESGPQTADTVVAENIVKMYARMPSPNRQSAVWLVHPDVEPQLHTMKIGDTPIYMPPGGLSASPYGLLMGRPVIPHQVCETVGDLGDIMFVDLTSYLTVTKTGGMRAETSLHFYFDQDITAFRFVMRIGGQPWWSTATPSRDGSHTMSPFVALAAR